jgi:hypothetical protein
MDITILSPGIYTYGAMLIGGVLRDAGHRVTLTRTARSCSRASSRPSTSSIPQSGT